MKQPEATQNFKIAEIWNFLLSLAIQILSPNTQIWSFWAKKHWFSNLNKMSHVLYFVCSNFKFVICFWKFRAQNPKFGNFGPKSINFLILTKFEGADFKLDIGFQKVWTQMPKFGFFGPKSINFLILTKFCMYPISKVLISNLTFVFENFGIS